MVPLERAEVFSIRSAILDQWRAWLVAVQFLTRLPTPDLKLDDEAERRASLCRATAYFPVVGLLIGLITASTILLAARVWPMVIAVLLGLVVEAVLTGAFHEDAVADFCDAFGGGWTREDVLRILKDSRVGSFGALGLGLAVALRGGSLASLAPDQLLAAVIASASLGRWAILPAMWALPPVADRESLSRDIGRQVGPGRLAFGSVLAVPGCLGLAWQSPIRLGLALLLVVAVVGWLVVYVRRRLGGITGDCLGFVCYSSQVVVLLVAAGQWPAGVAG
jgi:adenosylcobinamide-GDP ribazoletransferase